MAQHIVKSLLEYNRTDASQSGISIPMQIGKAAEHIVCAELILQGWNAFLSEAGMPYDVLVETQDCGRFYRVQVKSTLKMMAERTRKKGTNNVSQSTYRFVFRRSRMKDRRITMDYADFIACVALDVRGVAFLPVPAVIKADGFVPASVEFKSRRIEYRRINPTGKHPAKHGRFFEDFSKFDPGLEINRTEAVVA